MEKAAWKKHNVKQTEQIIDRRGKSTAQGGKQSQATAFLPSSCSRQGKSIPFSLWSRQGFAVTVTYMIFSLSTSIALDNHCSERLESVDITEQLPERVVVKEPKFCYSHTYMQVPSGHPAVHASCYLWTLR